MLIKECVIWCVWYPHKQPDMLSCQGLVRIRKEKAEAFTGIILGAISAPSHIDPFGNPCYVMLADGSGWAMHVNLLCQNWYQVKKETLKNILLDTFILD